MTSLVDHLVGRKPAGVTAEHQARLLERYRAVLDRDEWREVSTTFGEG